MATNPNVTVKSTVFNSVDVSSFSNVFEETSSGDIDILNVASPINDAYMILIDGDSVLVADGLNIKRISAEGDVSTIYAGSFCRSMVLLDDNTLICAASASSVVHIDLSDNTVIRTFTTATTPYMVAVSPDATTLGSADSAAPYEIEIFTIATGALVGTITMPSAIYALELSNDLVFAHTHNIAPKTFDIATMVEGDSPTPGLTDCASFCIDADNPLIAYAVPWNTAQLRVFELDGTWSQILSISVLGAEGAYATSRIISHTGGQVIIRHIASIVDTGTNEIYKVPAYVNQITTAASTPAIWEITGTIDESVAETSWKCTAYDLITGAVLGSTTTSTASFAITLSSSDAVKVTVEPSPIPIHVPATAYSLDDKVYPTDPQANPYYFKCTTAGTTGVTEPTWPSVPGATVIDGSLVWELVERINQPITHAPLLPTPI